MKKLGGSSTVASQSTNVEKMITDYLNEPLLEGPKLKFVKPLEYNITGSLMNSITLFWLTLPGNICHHHQVQ